MTGTEGVGADDCGVDCGDGAAPGSGVLSEGPVVPVVDGDVVPTGDGVAGTVVVPGPVVAGVVVSGAGCVLGNPFESIPIVPPELGRTDVGAAEGDVPPIPGVTDVGAPRVVPDGAVTPKPDWPGCPTGGLFGGGGGMMELGAGTPGVTGDGATPEGAACATDGLASGIPALAAGAVGVDAASSDGGSRASGSPGVHSGRDAAWGAGSCDPVQSGSEVGAARPPGAGRAGPAGSTCAPFGAGTEGPASSGAAGTLPGEDPPGRLGATEGWRPGAFAPETGFVGALGDGSPAARIEGPGKSWMTGAGWCLARAPSDVDPARGPAAAGDAVAAGAAPMAGDSVAVGDTVMGAGAGCLRASARARLA